MSILHISRSMSSIQKLVVQQVLLASTNIIQLHRPCAARFIMTTQTVFCNPTINPNITQVQHQEFKKYIDDRKCIIDVREPKELNETGVIPNSVNIPLGEIEGAFSLPNDVFQKKYNCSKPEIGETLIFSCRSGKRSNMACEKLLKLGYKNVVNYSGGWLDWEEKLKNV